MKQCQECFRFFTKAATGKTCPFCGSGNIGKAIAFQSISDNKNPNVTDWTDAVRLHNGYSPLIHIHV